MLLSRIAPAGALLLLSTLAGCAFAAAPAEDATTSTETLTSETFKLYSDVEPDLSGRCDIHTILTLSSTRGGDSRDPSTVGVVRSAHLYDEAVGACKIHVDSTPRDYALLFDREECGSLVYKAMTTVDGAARDITLTDNRKRLCEDFAAVPPIVVEEREDSGDIRTYSSPIGKTVPVT
jgi:hypothetical protein